MNLRRAISNAFRKPEVLSEDEIEERNWFLMIVLAVLALVVGIVEYL